MPNIFIVVSAYNEENNIKKVIEDLHKNNYNNIIVVDDGSVDNTKKIAKENGAEVITHLINRGRGATVQTGLSYALKKNADIIVTMDGDSQHQAKDIKKLIEPIMKKEIDVTLGSRFLKENNSIPTLRKILLKGSIIIERFLSGIKLTDAHNGLRAFSRAAAEKINITMRDRAYCTEIVEEIKKNNLKYKEVPVEIKYTKETLKKGLGVEAVKVLFKIILKRLYNGSN